MWRHRLTIRPTQKPTLQFCYQMAIVCIAVSDSNHPTPWQQFCLSQSAAPLASPASWRRHSAQDPDPKTYAQPVLGRAATMLEDARHHRMMRSASRFPARIALTTLGESADASQPLVPGCHSCEVQPALRPLHGSSERSADV
jgi:hypothetical protein